MEGLQEISRSMCLLFVVVCVSMWRPESVKSSTKPSECNINVCHLSNKIQLAQETLVLSGNESIHSVS